MAGCAGDTGEEIAQKLFLGDTELSKSRVFYSEDGLEMAVQH